MGRWLPKQLREARDREVIRLRLELGLTYWQIAERLGIHLSQVEEVMKKYRGDEEVSEGGKEVTAKGEPEGKEHRDYWSECGQVFFTGGKGYGLTPELETICLGAEAGILEAFKAGKLPDRLQPIQRQVLTQILEYRKELPKDGGAFKVKRPSDFRSKPAGAVKCREANIRQAPTRKRLPVHKA